MLSPDRPFRPWTRVESLLWDAQLLLFNGGLALAAGVILVLLPFNNANISKVGLSGKKGSVSWPRELWGVLGAHVSPPGRAGGAK